MYAVDEDECTGCGLCLEYCPSDALTMQGQLAEIDEESCTFCGSCLDACPRNAIYEYEELPAPPGGARAPATSSARGSSLALTERRPVLAKEQKMAAAAVLLPALSRFVLRLAGSFSQRGGGRGSTGLRQPAVPVSRGGHRWHGGR